MDNEELKIFLKCLHGYVDYWAEEKLNDKLLKCLKERGESETHYRLDGLVHSILALIDGVSAANDFHAYDIFYGDEIINNCYMHDLYYEKEWL